jgi:Zn-dependent protease
MRDLLSWNLYLGRIGGVQVRLHAFFLAFSIIALHLCAQANDRDLMFYGAASLVMLLASLLCHELGHSIVAVYLGGRVESMVLWPFGGLTGMGAGLRARDEQLVWLAGPGVNLGICLLTSLVLTTAGVLHTSLLNPLTPPALVKPFGWLGCVEVLFWINWILVVVNLLPAYPLDAGRFLRCSLRRGIGLQATLIHTEWIANVTAFVLLTLSVLLHQEYGFSSIPLALLGLLVFFSGRQEVERLHRQEESDISLGYDLSSEGDLGLEDEFRPADRRRVGRRLSHWIQQRREDRRRRKRISEEEEERQVDVILARVHESGLEELSREERALLHRVSARFRERQHR